MVALDISETSKALALGGGYAVFNSLISNWYKENLFLCESRLTAALTQAEALVAFCIGIAFGPKGAGVFNPSAWVGHSHHDLDYLSFQVSRIVMALQVMFTGLNLPKRYVGERKLGLFMLLIPVMTSAWFIVGLLVWALIPGLSFVEALVVGSIVTPTGELRLPLHRLNPFQTPSSATVSARVGRATTPVLMSRPLRGEIRPGRSPEHHPR